MKDARTSCPSARRRSYQDLVARLPERGHSELYPAAGLEPKGEEEIFTLEEMVKIFDESGISKSPAIFDPLKLRAINAEYIRRLPAEKFREMADPWIDQAVHVDIDRDLLCANLQPRCEVLGEIPEQLDFLMRWCPTPRPVHQQKAENQSRNRKAGTGSSAVSAGESGRLEPGCHFRGLQGKGRRDGREERLAAVPAGHRPVRQAAHPGAAPTWPP